jgi:hypothetical protein
MSGIMDPNIIVASKMTPLDLVIAVHRDSQAVLSYIVGLEEENSRLRTNPAGTLRHQLQSITQDGFNSMILEIDKVINTTNSTFACMQDQIRHALQTRSVASYITPRPNVLIHYPEPKKDEEKGNLMVRRGKDMLSISDLQHAFSKHDPLGRDSKVVQEGSAFQSFLDSARSIGIKCSPSQETTLKSTSAPQQTTPTKASGKCCDNNISDIEKTDPATNGKCCSNNISNIEKTDPTKAVVEAVIVPNLKYNMNQLLHLRKTACTNPFEHNTDEEIKLILRKGLEHRRRPSYVTGLPKRWSLNVSSTVSNIQMAKANVDSAVSDNEIKPLAAEVEPNLVSAVLNNENPGSSPLMTFSDTGESSKSIKPEKNVETMKWDIQPSNVLLSKVAHNDEASSFLAWMMSRDSMKLTGK